MFQRSYFVKTHAYEECNNVSHILLCMNHPFTVFQQCICSLFSQGPLTYCGGFFSWRYIIVLTTIQMYILSLRLWGIHCFPWEVKNAECSVSVSLKMWSCLFLKAGNRRSELRGTFFIFCSTNPIKFLISPWSNLWDCASWTPAPSTYVWPLSEAAVPQPGPG